MEILKTLKNTKIKNAYIAILISFLLIAFIFFVFTTEFFPVAIGSGVWFFLILLVSTPFVFSIFIYFGLKKSLRIKSGLFFIFLLFVTVITFLGLNYKPFNGKNILNKMGTEPLFSDSSDFEIEENENVTPLSIVNYEKNMPNPLDQGNCGSCSKFAVALMLSARYNIKQENFKKEKLKYCSNSNNYGNWRFSPEALINISNRIGSNKCNGDTIPTTVKDVQRGIPSAFCAPVFSGTGRACKISCGAPNTPNCLENSANFQYKFCPNQEANFSKSSCENAYLIKGEESMKRELTRNGPIVAILSYYETKTTSAGWALIGSPSIFSFYERLGFSINNAFVSRPKNDSFYDVNNDSGGYHAIVIYGYGESNGVKYWDVQNSWSTRWGYNGRIKIERGINAWNIESECYAAKL